RRNHGSAAPVPVFDYIRSAAYRNRQSILPTLPKMLSEIFVPRSLTVTSMNQSFLFCVTPGDNKILGLAPQLFYQSYSIHAWNDLSMKPMVFAATRQSYEQLLRSLVSYAESLDVKLEPKSIL
ncbi:unnamed protein product, partial [Didymodactylos carnosus]